MKWAIFTNPFLVPAFLIYAIGALAETKRAPFDLPEAGRGRRRVHDRVLRYPLVVLLLRGVRRDAADVDRWRVLLVRRLRGPAPALRAAGVEETALFGFVCFGTVMLKGLIGIFLMMWLRWTLPRVRIDQVMTMGYKYLTPLALFCVLGAACWEALVRALFS